MVQRVTFGLVQRTIASALLLLALHVAVCASAAELYAKRAGWVETMLGARTALMAAGLSEQERARAAEQVWFRVKADFPVQWDWALQDGERFAEWLCASNAPAMDAERLRLELYVKACEERRQHRLQDAVGQGAAHRLHQAPDRPPVVLRLHRGPVRRPGRAPLPARRGAVPAGDGRPPRQGSHAARRPDRRDPRSRRLLRRPARALRLEEVAPRGRLSPLRNGRRRRTASGRLTSGWASPTTSGAICPTATSSSTPRAACRPWIAGGPRSAISTPATRTASTSAGWASTRCTPIYPAGDWTTAASSTRAGTTTTAARSIRRRCSR